MAAKPTPGGSDGTYGTELNEFLDVSLAADGKIKDGAVQTTSASPTTNAMLANKKYVDDLTKRAINGTPTFVSIKYLQGTMGSGDLTVAHEIAGNQNLILNVTASIEADQDSSGFFGSAKGDGGDTNFTFGIRWDNTNVYLEDVGSNLVGGTNEYVIKIEFKTP